MRDRTWPWALLGFLVLTVYFHGLGSYGLLDPDEGRYSEIPREMIESGDFVTPRLNYVKYFEKPVLHYWLTAGAFLLCGENEFGGRLVPVLMGLGGCLLAFCVARRVTGSGRASWLSALTLATSILWYALSRINLTDMTLTFFFTLALLGYRLWLDGEKRRWLLLFYAGMALATLTKGLVGVVLPGGIAVLHLTFTRRWRSLPRLFSPLAIALYFAIAVPWFWAVCRANPDFFDFFFIREHLLRYLTTVHDRYEPVWFFIPIILAAFVPWTGMLWDAARAAFGKCALVSRDDGIFLGLWAALPFVFFSLSNSKLIPYILPCMPPAAILIGAAMETADRRALLRFIGLNAIILLPLALTGLLWPPFSENPDVRAMTVPALMLSAGLLLFWGASFLLTRRPASGSLLLGALALFVLFAASPAFKIEADRLSRRDIAACVPEGAEDVVVYQSLMQGMPFYLGRRVVTADILNELSFGAERESDPRWFLSKEQLHRLWTSPRRVLVVAENEDRDSLVQTLGKDPVRTWSSTGDVLFANF
ncbi:MAG: glycosyltransferase family 39 protein [Synergistaceae bacterium]|nr:glycosyltransferase family 39 protein [Synergistaceae bacterium]